MATAYRESAMIFTRQFRALLKLSMLWAGAWALAGLAVGVHTWTPPTDPTLARFQLSFPGWLLVHGLVYGAVGVISGVAANLLIARMERGRRVAEISVARAAMWGSLGGALPLTLFGALAAVFGIPEGSLLPAIGLGVASAGISAAVGASAVSVARREAVESGRSTPRLPAI